MSRELISQKILENLELRDKLDSLQTTRQALMKEIDILKKINAELTELIINPSRTIKAFHVKDLPVIK